MVKELEIPVVKCANCCKIWQYDKEDIHEGTQQIYSGEEYKVHYIICPKCGSHLEVYPK